MYTLLHIMLMIIMCHKNNTLAGISRQGITRDRVQSKKSTRPREYHCTSLQLLNHRSYLTLTPSYMCMCIYMYTVI